MSIDVQISKTQDTAQGDNKYPAMATGLHAAVIKDVKDLGKKSFGDNEPKQTYVAEFVNAKGEQASRFYTPSLFEGNAKSGPSNLASDLKALDGKVPDTFVMRSLIGRQVQVLTKQGVNKKGYPSSKVTDVMAPAPGQNVTA